MKNPILLKFILTSLEIIAPTIFKLILRFDSNDISLIINSILNKENENEIDKTIELYYLLWNIEGPKIRGLKIKMGKLWFKYVPPGVRLSMLMEIPI